MSILILEAQKKHAKDIADIHQDTWKSTYKGIIPDTYFASLNPTHYVDQWNEYFNQESDSNKTVFVAISGQDLIGFIAGGRERTNQFPSFSYEIYAIYVHKQFQKKRSGTKVVR